ncbi:MAG: SRPBCC domain-containing protein [Acidimicrobiales bacterium]
MTVVSTQKNPEDLTLVVVAEFTASPEQVFELWEDPRKLERWWGPPTFPATFSRHDFFVGGESRYFMTGPEGETPHGWWRIDAIDRPHRIDFANGLAGDDGEPVPGVEPMAESVTFEQFDGGTRMTALTRFVSVEQMDLMLAMGMEEGMKGAMSQIDELLVAH